MFFLSNNLIKKMPLKAVLDKNNKLSIKNQALWANLKILRRGNFPDRKPTSDPGSVKIGKTVKKSSLFPFNISPIRVILTKIWSILTSNPSFITNK